jgi:hypothetical protein
LTGVHELVTFGRIAWEEVDDDRFDEAGAEDGAGDP